MKKFKRLVCVLFVFMMLMSLATIGSAQETTLRPAPTVVKLGIEDNELFTIIGESDKFDVGYFMPTIAKKVKEVSENE